MRRGFAKIGAFDVTGTAASTRSGDGGRSELDAGLMFGRFMLADMTEHPCRVTNLSIDGVTGQNA